MRKLEEEIKSATSIKRLTKEFEAYYMYNVSIRLGRMIPYEVKTSYIVMPSITKYRHCFFDIYGSEVIICNDTFTYNLKIDQ